MTGAPREEGPRVLTGEALRVLCPHHIGMVRQCREHRRCPNVPQADATQHEPDGGEPTVARTIEQRVTDSAAKLKAGGDAWLATLGPAGPHLVPLSLARDSDSSELIFCTERRSVTDNNIASEPAVRVGLGPTRDVVMIDGTARTTGPVQDDANPSWSTVGQRERLRRWQLRRHRGSPHLARRRGARLLLPAGGPGGTTRRARRGADPPRRREVSGGGRRGASQLLQPAPRSAWRGVGPSPRD